MFSMTRDPYDPGTRRFPAPWTVEQNAESFIVRDATGLPLAYLYIEDNNERRFHMNRLTRDEGRRIAAGIARLPELMGQPNTKR